MLMFGHMHAGDLCVCSAAVCGFGPFLVAHLQLPVWTFLLPILYTVSLCSAPMVHTEFMLMALLIILCASLCAINWHMLLNSQSVFSAKVQSHRVQLAVEKQAQLQMQIQTQRAETEKAYVLYPICMKSLGLENRVCMFSAICSEPAFVEVASLP